MQFVGCSKTVPYFIEVPMSQVQSWKPSNYPTYPAPGSGHEWELKTLSGGLDHLVWLHDGKAFQMEHIFDRRFDGVYTWGYKVLGSKLYIYDHSKFLPEGWCDLKGNDVWSMGPLNAPKDAALPEHLLDGGIYLWDGRRLQFVATPTDYREWFRKHRGKYFVAPNYKDAVARFELDQRE